MGMAARNEALECTELVVYMAIIEAPHPYKVATVRDSGGNYHKDPYQFIMKEAISFENIAGFRL